MPKRPAMYRFLSGSLFALSCFTPGCTPSYHPDFTAPEDPAWALERASDEALTDGTFRSAPWIEEEWWHMFADDQLDELIYRAELRNPTVKIADALVWLAAARAKIAGAPLFPTLDINADLQRTHQSGTGIFGIFPGSTFPLSYTQTELLSAINYEIDWWGKNRNALRAALGEVQAALAETAQARLILSISLANAYFQMQTDLARIHLARNYVSNLENTVRLSRQRVQNGLDSNLTLNGWLAQLMNAKNSLAALEQDLAAEKNEIRMYLAGDFLDEFDESRARQGLLPPFPLPCNLPMDLISHRPDITAQIWKIESSGRQIQVARAMFYPNINLMSLLGYQTIINGELLKWKSWYGLGEPAIHLPIFEGGRLAGNLQASECEYVIAVQEYEDMLLHAVRDVLNGITNLQKLTARLADLSRTAETFEENYRLTEAKFKNNLSSELDLLASERDLLAAKDNVAALRGFIAQALLDLVRALGGGYDVNSVKENV